jgi:hypothetical protein
MSAKKALKATVLSSQPDVLPDTYRLHIQVNGKDTSPCTCSLKDLNQKYSLPLLTLVRHDDDRQTAFDLEF